MNKFINFDLIGIITGIRRCLKDEWEHRGMSELCC